MNSPLDPLSCKRGEIGAPKEKGESVPGFMDGIDIIPTLKRGVNPNNDQSNVSDRANPPIHWWDKSAPTHPQQNRFNGLKDKG